MAKVMGAMSPTAATVAPTEKCKHRTLGPRGLRKTGSNIYHGGKVATNYRRRSPGGSREEKETGGLAAFFREEEKMRGEGYRLFPTSFKPPPVRGEKTFQFVSNYRGLLTTHYCSYYELAPADLNKNREVPVECINPFKQGTPYGEKTPLPR